MPINVHSFDVFITVLFLILSNMFKILNTDISIDLNSSHQIIYYSFLYSSKLLFLQCPNNDANRTMVKLLKKS